MLLIMVFQGEIVPNLAKIAYTFFIFSYHLLLFPPLLFIGVTLISYFFLSIIFFTSCILLLPIKKKKRCILVFAPLYPETLSSTDFTASLPKSIVICSFLLHLLPVVSPIFYSLQSSPIRISVLSELSSTDSTVSLFMFIVIL